MMKLSVLILITSYLLLFKKEDSINYAIINKIDYHPYELKEEEMLTLQDIASRCPLKYGQAVYSARVLINTQHGHENEFWDDEDICIYGVNYRRGNPIKTDEISDNIIFYPNPAKDLLYYKVNANLTEIDDIKILIQDMQGKSIKDVNINDNAKSGIIGLSGIADGIYIIKYLINDKNFSSQKLVIQK